MQASIRIMSRAQANSSLELLLHRLQARGSPHAAILEHVPTQLPSQAARAVAIATQATQQAQVGYCHMNLC